MGLAAGALRAASIIGLVACSQSCSPTEGGPTAKYASPSEQLITEFEGEADPAAVAQVLEISRS
ncbi:MAG: hypothetical protein IPG96_06940 [Proteobacteria bacterium]|nr:hypothetical protein [Pseudomonadota bacterium]